MCFDACTGKPPGAALQCRSRDVPSTAPLVLAAIDPGPARSTPPRWVAQLLALAPTERRCGSERSTRTTAPLRCTAGAPSRPSSKDNVVVNGLNAGWGDLARTSNRYFAFDKKDGPHRAGLARRRPAITTPTTPTRCRRHRRRAPADGRRHRRRRPRAEPLNRRAALRVPVHQAGDEQQHPDAGRQRQRHPQRGESRHQRDGPGRGYRRHGDGQGGAEPGEVGDAWFSRRIRLTGGTTNASTTWTTAQSSAPSTVRPAGRCGTGTSERFRKARPCSPTESCTSERRTEVLHPSSPGRRRRRAR